QTRLIWLRAEIASCLARVASDPTVRPLLAVDDPAETLRGLLEGRQRFYAAAEMFVDTDGRSIETIVDEIERRLRPAPEAVRVELGERSYEVRFGTRGIAQVADEYLQAFAARRAVVVTDSNVARHYGDDLMRAFGARGVELKLEVVPAGEASKSLRVVEELLDALIAWKADRKTPLVAFGGGVVGDLAGFVAATLFRGVPLMQVPTTLLAQVDSSIGGKTGVNHRLGKNLIGAFYQPRVVYVDPSFLETLPEREYLAGLAEVVKYGAIADDALFRLLEREVEAIVRKDPEILATIIRESVAIKADVVSRDEKEGGLRAILNYGHTLGHAIEAGAGYGTLLHGEAVALGIVWVNDLAAEVGGSALGEDAVRIRDLLARLRLPVDYAPYQDPELVALASHDKKTRGRAIELVLLERIGAAERRSIEQSTFLAAACRCG
ncbi:MAG: 3-dehydroquinate synthase, partial [Myxococcales bacterium]|nr:3-dehydroquinate synthase [Myxococcales bacterium]